MGAKIMGSIFDYVLTPPQQIVLLAYADHSDHFGKNIFPSKRLIAWKTGYGVRQVQRITEQLLEVGILKVMEAPLGKPTKYSIDLSKGVKKPDYVEPKKKGEKVRQDDIRQDVTPDILADDPRHSYVTPTPDMGEPKVSDEPSVKPLEPITAPTSAAIIEAWIVTQDATIPNAYKLKTNHELARGMIDKGITVQDVKNYLDAMSKDTYWGNKFIELPKMAKEIAKWKKTPTPNPSPANGTNGHAPARKVTAQMAVRIQEEADLMGVPYAELEADYLRKWDM